jgi:hypothetical protein
MSVTLATAAQPAFARHETFHPRYGWLRKAVSAADEHPHVFTDPDATVTLGVGKNMVVAIRYWATAFKLLESTPNPDRPRLPGMRPTEFGLDLLGDDGWDPYLEEPASLWLLHWKLLAAPCLAPVWWVAFHDFAARQFTESALAARVTDLATAAGWPPVVRASVDKDVDCLLRTYTVRRAGRQGLDDFLDCPFRELTLIERAAASNEWRFVVGPKPSLPPALVLYAALDFATGESASMTVARLAHDLGGPGRAFRLTEVDIYEYLLAAAADEPRVRVVEPGGLRQLVFDDDPAKLARSALARVYERSYAGVRT